METASAEQKASHLTALVDEVQEEVARERRAAEVVRGECEDLQRELSHVRQLLRTLKKHLTSGKTAPPPQLQQLEAACEGGLTPLVHELEKKGKKELDAGGAGKDNTNGVSCGLLLNADAGGFCLCARGVESGDVGFVSKLQPETAFYELKASEASRLAQRQVSFFFCCPLLSSNNMSLLTVVGLF